MDHDPLCELSHLPFPACWLCDLIAKVRADERNRVFTLLDSLAEQNHADDCEDLTCAGCGK